MARKPAKTKIDDSATTAIDEATAKDAAAIPDEGSLGSNTAGESPDAPEGVAQAADAPGQAGGEEGPNLPANTPAPDHHASDADLHADSGEGATATITEAKIFCIVTCHRDGGRRRAGRRWRKGETPVREDELTAYDLAQLQGDPQFTITMAERD